MSSKSSFTFHIAKEGDLPFPEYLTENARAEISSSRTQALGIRGFGERAAVFIFQGNLKAPTWLTQLSIAFEDINVFQTSSGAGVLLFEKQGNVLATTFAHGWMFLDQDQFEADFGLKVAVNALDEGRLRRLDRSNLGDALQGISQSPFRRDFRSLWTSDALDVVGRLTGETRSDVTSDAMSGSRSLKVTGDYTIDDIPDLGEELTALYESNRYQQTDFAIIDFVRPVRDRLTIRRLEEAAVQSIKAHEQSFEIALPIDISAEATSFHFQGPRLRRRYPDLLLRHYQQVMGEQITKLTVDMLDAHKIVALFDDNRPPSKRSIKKSLVGSIDLNGHRYAANEGQWFRVDDVFRNSMEDSFAGLLEAWPGVRPPPPRTYFDEKRNGRVEREEHYNRYLGEQLDLAVLDKRFIQIPNVARSSFESCDLLDVPNRKFIHLKMSSRRSNVLSHFFKQGSNSARQFRRVPACWDQLSRHLRELGRDDDASTLGEHRTRNDDRWTVEFWIADAPRENGDYNIPFFSKITLHDEAQDLFAMGFNVKVRFVGRNPALIE